MIIRIITSITLFRLVLQTAPITLTSGVISPPFGKARLLVTKLIAVLISLNNSEINKEIIHCDIPELLLVRNAFFDMPNYRWLVIVEIRRSFGHGYFTSFKLVNFSNKNTGF